MLIQYRYYSKHKHELSKVIILAARRWYATELRIIRVIYIIVIFRKLESIICHVELPLTPVGCIYVSDSCNASAIRCTLEQP